MIKYNLKKILIEEDDIDIVDPFYTKYDEVPDRFSYDDEWEDEEDSPEWRDYMEDLQNHVEMVLNYHIHNTNMKLPTLHPSRNMNHTKIPDSDGPLHPVNKKPLYTRYPTEEEYQLDWDDWVKDYIRSGTIEHIHSDDHMKNFYPGGWIKNFHDFIDSRGLPGTYKKGRWGKLYQPAWPHDGNYSLDDED